MKRSLIICVVLLLSGISVFAQKTNPTPVPFLMEIEDVFYINGVGTVATGKVERGSVKAGDQVEIVGIRPTLQTTVVRLEAFGKSLTEAAAGTNVGLVLKGVQKTDVTRGQMIAKPGSIKAYKKIKAKIDLFEVKDGGRKTPITTGFRPQIFFRKTGFSGIITLPAGKTNAAAGEKGVTVEIELTEPAAIEKGDKISLREYGKTVAGGIVTELILKK